MAALLGIVLVAAALVAGLVWLARTMRSGQETLSATLSALAIAAMWIPVWMISSCIA